MAEPTDEPTGKPTGGPTGDAHPAAQTAETTPMSQYSYPQSAGETSAPQGEPAYGTTSAQQLTGVELADEPQAGRGGRKRTGLLVGGLAAVLLLGGAGVFAAQQLSGSGLQPADVLPGDAFGYVRLDIDPSAGQKIAAVRFLSKLPQLKDTLGADDPRKKVWELATKDAGDCLSKLSYDSDIAPWLGDRIGAAIRPGGTADKPNLAVAIQVKDEDRAKNALTRAFACDKSGGSDLRVKDGYAIVTPPGVGDSTMAAVAKGTLAQNATFKGDMAALGEQGVLSAWFDLGPGLKEIQNASGGFGTAPAAGAQGRIVAALRFDPNYVELAGLTRGVTGATGVRGSGAELANLPDDTMVAMHLAGADQALDKAWPALEKQLQALGKADGENDMLGQIEQGLGVKFPDDLKVLFGSSFTLALPQQDFAGGVPVAGGKIVTSNPKRAEELLDTIDQLAGGSGVLTHSAEGNKVYLATQPDYAAKLKTGGKLGESEAFKAAVGDVSSSNYALFVDLDKLEKLYLKDVDADTKAFVESLRAVGLNMSTTGDGAASFSLRVLGN